MTNDDELAQWPFALQAPFRFYGNTEPSSRKTAQRCGLTSITVIACDSFEVQKGSQLFIRRPQRNAFRCRGVRLQSRLFARWNQLRRCNLNFNLPVTLLDSRQQTEWVEPR
jgi:hypothetical protein